jgi:signal peptidase
VKGDANDSPDGDLVQKYQIIGRVNFSIPYIGYLVAFARTLPGLIICIIVPALVIVYEEVGKIQGEVKAIRSAKKKVTEEAEKIGEDIIEEEKKIVKHIKERSSSGAKASKKNTK